MTAYHPTAIVFTILLLASPTYSQLPFFTDDADTTPKKKFHVEFFNEDDWLQRSSFPGRRQNISNFTLNYGLTDRIELGVNVPYIKILNERSAGIGDPSGIGDTQIGMKMKLRDEHEGSRMPAIAVVFYFEAPTGSVGKQIGSGLADYWLYGVVQKKLTKRTTGRLNAGILFAGNRSFGLVRTQDNRGQVFTGNGSLVRDFTPKLKLGVELFGAATKNSNLGRSRLMGQFGGSYSPRDNFAVTFGVLGGRFTASPRLGLHVGLAYDFE